MLHQGFDSLFFKKTDIPIYFPKYEAENNFIFPDSYKKFADLYYLGKDSLRKEYCLEVQNKLMSPLLSYYYGEDNTYMSLEDFLSIEEIVNYKKLDLEEFEVGNLGMVRIVFTNDVGGGGIYLGIDSYNYGKIYKASWSFLDKQDGLVLLTDNIFEFVKGIKSIQNSHHKINYSKLYKNWGEDFWRIKEG